jgi:hypothetical protein
MFKIALFVAAVSLTPAVSWNPPECHQDLAQEAKLDVADEARKQLRGWSGHSFNASVRYTTIKRMKDQRYCKDIIKTLQVNDSVYLSGVVTPDGGVVTAKSGNGRWAGEVKMYVSPSFAGFPNPPRNYTNSHICTTINGVKLHGKINWFSKGTGETYDIFFTW